MKKQMFDDMIREAVADEVPHGVDAVIYKAIARRAAWNKVSASFAFRLSVSVAAILLIFGGMAMYFNSRGDEETVDDGILALEILGMASAEDFYVSGEYESLASMCE